MDSQDEAEAPATTSWPGLHTETRGARRMSRTSTPVTPRPPTSVYEDKKADTHPQSPSADAAKASGTPRSAHEENPSSDPRRASEPAPVSDKEPLGSRRASEPPLLKRLSSNKVGPMENEELDKSLQI